MMIDDWVTLGSSNLNHRSFLHDLEVDVVVQTEEVRSQLLSTFEQDLVDCQKVEQNRLASSGIKYWLGRFLLYFRYWM